MTTAVLYAKMPQAAADGSNLQFTFDFPVYDDSELRVILTNSAGVDTDLALDTDYELVLNADQGVNPGGYINTLPAATPIATGNFLTLVSDIPNTQDTFLPSATSWNPRIVMFALDRLTRLVAQIQEQADRSLKLPIAEVDGLSVEFPKAAERAEHYVLFDADGNAALAPNILTDAVVPTAFSENLIETADDANEYLTGLGISDFARDNVLLQTTADGILTGLGFTAYGIELSQLADSSALTASFGYSAFFSATLGPQTDATNFMSALGFSSYAAATLVTLADQAALTAEVSAGLGISAFAATLLDDATAGDALTTLGVSAFVQTILDDAADSDVLTTLGVSPFVQTLFDDVSAVEVVASLGLSAPRGHIDGLTLANNLSDAVNDINIAVGEATDTTQASIMRLETAITKQLDVVWGIGTNAGMLDTGAIANGTYHIFLIQRSDTGAVDILASTNVSAPTLPTNYDLFRRIGSIVRAGATIVQFIHNGDTFGLAAAVLDISAANPGTAAVLATMTVPTGIVVEWAGSILHTSTAVDSLALLSSPQITDVAPSLTLAPLGTTYADASGDNIGTNQARIYTNTAAQIRYRLSASDANTTLRVATRGWIDTRGRNN